MIANMFRRSIDGGFEIVAPEVRGDGFAHASELRRYFLFLLPLGACFRGSSASFRKVHYSVSTSGLRIFSLTTYGMMISFTSRPTVGNMLLPLPLRQESMRLKTSKTNEPCLTDDGLSDAMPCQMPLSLLDDV